MITGSDLDERTNPANTRVEVLEAKIDSMARDLKDTKATLQAVREEVAWLRGRTETLPKTLQMALLVFGIIGGGFLILQFGSPHG